MEHFVSLSDLWILQYMPHAPAPFVKVYLYGLFQMNSLYKIDNHLIASALEMLPSEVVQAWNYWEEEEVVRKKEIVNELDFQIDFLLLKSKLYPTAYTPECPEYSPKELQIYMQNKDVRDLFTMTEKKLGRTLNDVEKGIVFSFYDWLRLPLEVIDVLLDFCIKEGAINMRDFQDMAYLWSKEKITSMEKALNFMRHYQSPSSKLDRQK